MADIDLGRKLAASVRQVSIPNTPTTPIIGPDPYRTRIVVSGDGTQLVHLWPQGLSLTTATGFALPTLNPQMTMTVEVWGKLVTGSWFAEDGGNASTLTIAEMTLDQQ